MTGILLHTLVWTGALIVLVLALRRPVSRHFGPEAAYALWALPLVRLVLPPVTLPAWMAPPPAPEPATEPLPEAVLATVSAVPPADAALWQTAAMPAAPAAHAPAAAPPPAGFDLLAELSVLPWAEALLLVWLGGAAAFLSLRFSAYFALRHALLAEGREVGRVAGLFGKVRLVETPAIKAPLAMGVLDPVIALPPGFLALHDRTSRDLALAHELAHHRGGDLLVNILVQPLFALHWFNPLARYGWLALRRDQEAACDARVMARRSGEERAAYAALIARFAAAPGATHTAALAAPMACPVLGETSIIHRLRSLAMSDPTPRRRLMARALLGAGLLALPLTATISYAASESVLAAPQVPEPPAPPAPPAPPLAPDAPLPPEAPQPPAPPAPPVIMTIDPDNPEGRPSSEVTEHVWHDADGNRRNVRIVTRAPRAGWSDEQRKAMRQLEGAEREAMLAELHASLAEADRVLADVPNIVERAMAEARAAHAAHAAAPRVVVRQECKPGTSEVSETTSEGGVQVVSICQKRILASARAGLEKARAEIAADPDISEDTRKQVLRSLDRQIARWNDNDG